MKNTILTISIIVLLPISAYLFILLRKAIKEHNKYVVMDRICNDFIIEQFISKE
jgi:hypothetical protein